jgi:hypothetical protein
MQGNAYNSLVNTYYGPDLYNLPLGTGGAGNTPPADLSLAASVFAPSYFYYRFGTSTVTTGFQANGARKTDNPFLRSLGIFCNMGECLVDISPSHGSAKGLGIRLQLERFAPSLTGVIANTAGSAAVTGTGTLFLSELAVGMTIMWVDGNFVARSGVILSITDDLNLTLTAVSKSTGMFTGNSAATPAYPLVALAGTSVDIPIPTLNALYPFGIFVGDVSKAVTPSGLVTMVTGSAAVVGKDTKFTSQLIVGQPIQWLDDSGTRRTSRISTITDDTHLSMIANAPSNVTRLTLLDYQNWNAGSASNPASMMLKATVANDLKYSTILLDPAFGGASSKNINFNAVAEIESNLDLIQKINR